MAANSVLSSTITCFRKRFKLNSHKKTTHPRFIPISAPRFILISAPRFIPISAPRFILISAPRFILISVPSIRSVPHPYPCFILTLHQGEDFIWSKLYTSWYCNRDKRLRWLMPGVFILNWINTRGIQWHRSFLDKSLQVRPLHIFCKSFSGKRMRLNLSKFRRPDLVPHIWHRCLRSNLIAIAPANESSGLVNHVR